MNCPQPEHLSRWTDGTLDDATSRAVEAHAADCPACARKAEELMAVGAWLERAAEPGPECLSADAMAALLEGRGSMRHVEACPRCAAEYAALRPSARKITVRRSQGRWSWAPWAAAAAVFVTAGVLALASRDRAGEEARTALAPKAAPDPLPPAPERPKDFSLPEVPPPAPIEKKKPAPAPAAPPAPSVVKAEDPPTPFVPAPPKPVAPPPVEEPATPDVPAPKPPPTVTVPVERRMAAVAVRSGALAALVDGRWVRVPAVEEGATVRAEGRTVCEFADAKLTFEGSAKLSFAGADVSLQEGGLAAEIPVGSPLGLVLGAHKVEPQVSLGRALVMARPDRVVVDEGWARVGKLVLAEGVEYFVRKDRLEPRNRRTLAAAPRPRETVQWRMDFSNPAAIRRGLMQGRLALDGEERMLVAQPFTNNPYFHGMISYYLMNDDRGLFTVRPGTCLRVRYFLSQPSNTQIVLRGLTKDINFNKDFEAVAGQWTTLTIPVTAVPPNVGAVQHPIEVGDKYRGVGIFVGKPGQGAELYVDVIEVVDLEN